MWHTTGHGSLELGPSPQLVSSLLVLLVQILSLKILNPEFSGRDFRVHASFLVRYELIILHLINSLVKPFLFYFCNFLLIQELITFFLLPLCFFLLYFLDLMWVQIYLFFIFVLVSYQPACLHTTLVPGEDLAKVALLHVNVRASDDTS
jgi:hypothetical protein